MPFASIAKDLHNKSQYWRLYRRHHYVVEPCRHYLIIKFPQLVLKSSQSMCSGFLPLQLIFVTLFSSELIDVLVRPLPGPLKLAADLSNLNINVSETNRFAIANQTTCKGTRMKLLVPGH
jgi:hypothetical protein